MRAFNELMLTGSVSQAARNLKRSQPSVSALISALEKQIGMQLFERRNGRLLPVPEAHYLQEECGELLRRISEIDQNMQHIRTLDSGQISVASMPGPSLYFIPCQLAVYAQSHPNIRSTVVSRSSAAVYQLVATQQYDVGLADHDIEQQGSASVLVDAEVFTYELLLALPADDPLATRPTLGPPDIAGRPLATIYREHRTHHQMQEVFQRSGVTAAIKFESQHFPALLTYVEMRAAYALIDPLTASGYQAIMNHTERLAFVPFKPAIGFDVALIQPAHRPLSLAAKDFVKTLKEALQNAGDMQAHDH